MLASNGLAELADLDVLARFARLTQLVLMDNPVTKKEVRCDPLSPSLPLPSLPSLFLVVVAAAAMVVLVVCCGIRGVRRFSQC